MTTRRTPSAKTPAAKPAPAKQALPAKSAPKAKGATATQAPVSPTKRKAPAKQTTTQQPLRVAVIGAGMAGVACARTLAQAGCHVTLIEKSKGFGGRMATRHTEFGGFDHGAQYFTARDPRFEKALATTPDVVVPWSASTVRVLDALGHVLASNPPAREAHYVAAPGMNALVRTWAQPLADAQHPLAPSQGAAVRLNTRVTRLARDPIHTGCWELHADDETTEGAQTVLDGFDRVVLALPHRQAADLLKASGLDKGAGQTLLKAVDTVTVAPCWTLMLAFPNAMQPGLPHLGPQWNAARSTHHRISWLAREGSKPRRDHIERWTVQASPAWSAEHLEDSPERVTAKLCKAFSEVTGIRAEPSHAVVHRWRFAQTQNPLGQSHLWAPALGVGLCGDWCLGHRVEDAFISGLEMALAVLA
ncbi:MAG: FAD-dependent oxidoreductase [Burkholderiales bacterium]|nr:FAD-dependent oxidoreductase [Burkholderiales bacterium]